MQMPASVRVAVALSGGVDSSVVALLLSRCVRTLGDVRALTLPRHAPPSRKAVMDGIQSAQPLSVWGCGTAAAASRRTDDDALVELLPLFMKNWDDVDSPNGWCERSARDYDDATAVAHSLGMIPATRALPALRLASEYVACCFDPMLRAYAEGRTLNVDVLCNEHIKFGHLWQHLRHPSDGSAPADFLATGHYARTWASPSLGVHGSLVQRPFSAALDLNDQTVFLSRVSARVVAHALFPLGHLFSSKQGVRHVARWWWGQQGLGHLCAAAQLHTLADKKTSTGICFVGKPSHATSGTALPRRAATHSTLSFAHFLNEYIPHSTASDPPSPDEAPSVCPCVIKTRFLDADTGTALEPQHFTWSHTSELLAEYSGSYLPSFAFTLGQKLLYKEPADHGGPRGGGTRAQSTAHRRLYVWKKDLVHDTTSANAIGAPVVARVCTVWLVSRWDDERLWSTHVGLTHVQLHPPLSMRLPATTAAPICQTLRCWCCTRHQEKLRLAALTVVADGPPGTTSVLDCHVTLDEPVRALTPGQAVVVYMTPTQVNHLDAGLPAPNVTTDVNMTDLVVVASGWVAAGSET